VQNQDIDSLAAEIHACRDCLLSVERKQAVPGVGSATAQVVFVGEAPGAKEDVAGIPFCGAAGKFLDEMLAENSFRREEVFITNICKCRPPGNRDPEPAEKKACSEKFLRRQLEILAPRLVVALGRHAGSFFLPELRISRDHGQFFRRPAFPFVILPLYHPAAALYNGSQREIHKRDFRKIRVFLEQEESRPE